MPSKGPTEYYSPQPKGTFGRNQSTQPFSMDRTFSASSTDFRQTSGVFDNEDSNEDVFKESHELSHHNQHQHQFQQHYSNIEAGNLDYIHDISNPSIAHNDPSSRGNSSRGKGDVTNEETFFDDGEISVGLPSDLPSGMVDIEGNIIGNVDNMNFGQDEEDMSSIEESNQEHGNNQGINNNDSFGNSQSQQIQSSGGAHGHVHRKKSILSSRSRYNKSGGGCSVNSFNGSAGGSSIISDGKMGGSMNGSFNSQFYNNFYSRAARRNDFQRYTRGPYAPLDRCNSTSASSATSNTITQHYYPEGGWGFVVLTTALFSHALLCGFLLSGGIFSIKVLDRFGPELKNETVWLTSLSLGLSLFLSPIWVSICKRKSTRLTAVLGGLVSSLGCLFTSFASQFHQLYFSYALFLGVGVGLTRDASMLMVGQYFKRKRDFVEILLVSGSGLGILVMSVFMECAISSVGWRLGLQAVTGSLAITFFLGSCYRSASLYHPQRRAILHLKNQKRKIKEKEKKSDGPPFLDFSCLSSSSIQVLVVSTFFTGLGLYGPLFHLAFESYEEGVENAERLFLYIYIGSGWVIGSCLFGFLSIQRTEDCRISKLYLCQGAALMIGISMLTLANIKDSSGNVTFSWAYGIGLGGYSSMLKIHAYDKARARVFPRAWSFIQCVQGAALFLGIPLVGYINTHVGWRKGYYASAGSVFLGSFVMLLSGVGKRGLLRNKSRNSSMKTCETTDSMQSPGLRRISFTFPDEQMSPRISKENRSSCSDRSAGGSISNDQPLMPKELTRISEEGILDN